MNIDNCMSRGLNCISSSSYFSFFKVYLFCFLYCLCFCFILFLPDFSLYPVRRRSVNGGARTMLANLSACWPPPFLLSKQPSRWQLAAARRKRLKPPAARHARLKAKSYLLIYPLTPPLQALRRRFARPRRSPLRARRAWRCWKQRQWRRRARSEQ